MKIYKAMKKTYINTEIELINPDATYISLNEIRKLFNPPLSYTTLWKWQKKGFLKLTPRVISNKRYYHMDEVIQEIERHKRPNE